MSNLTAQLKKTKTAQPGLATLSFKQRNQTLVNLSKLLIKHQKEILTANVLDLKNLKRLEMRDRLVLNEKRLKGMAEGLVKVSKLSDPLNKILEKKKLPNGLDLKRLSVPLGVVGVIYESRPNVTIDLAGIAIKTGNGLILKGGSEAYYSNKVLMSLIHLALKQSKLSTDLIYLIDPKEDWKDSLLNAHGLVDVLIPRGSNSLIKWVRENSKIPVIETGAGVCHIFVDSSVNIDKAVDIIINAKVQRPDVCNALDTLVIHHKSLKILSEAAKKLAHHHVVIYADVDSYRALTKIYPKQLLNKAKPSDFGKEFLSLTMSIKTVKSFEQGLEFVKQNTSGHSESILSNDKNHITKFLSEVDAAVVYANASTRFTDGEEFGMGAEVGISTQKLHARGPMGLEALTSYKWIAQGNWIARK